jgi:hypothetical protein
LSFISVDIFANDSDEDMIVFLELLCEEIHVSAGLSFELFIEDIPHALPITINYSKQTLQIYPNQGIPKWLIEFNGQQIEPGYPTILKNYLT